MLIRKWSLDFHDWKHSIGKTKNLDLFSIISMRIFNKSAADRMSSEPAQAGR
jgi:hypothetical protein